MRQDNTESYKHSKILSRMRPTFGITLADIIFYVMRSNYLEAERCLKKATALDPENDTHHHSLGMVYRFEIANRFDSFIRRAAKGEAVSPDDAFRDMEDLYAAAEQCFETTRKLDDETEYGYITNIQLILETIEKLYRLSGKDQYADLLASQGAAGEWCREKLPLAEDLLRRVKHLKAQEDPSRRTVECQGKILNIYGDFASMINSLQTLLKSDRVERAPIRRTMANAYVARRKYDWSAMKAKDLQKVYFLMKANIEEEVFSPRDIWMWFQAYRRVPQFDMLEALDLFNRLAMRNDLIEAYYYLYILYFIRWRQGILGDFRRVLDNIAECQRLAGKISRTRSHEWLGNEPVWCPLIHQSELKEWDQRSNFYVHTDPLVRVEGVVKRIKGAQSGQISLGPFDVFFVPGTEFLPGRDENAEVDFYLGFSYEGLRGWSVRRST